MTNEKTDYEGIYDKEYEKFGDYHWQKDKSHVRNFLLSQLDDINAYILDAGCGDAYLLAQLGPKAVGLDISPKALELAAKHTNHKLVQGSVLDIPFPDNEFDIVIMEDVLEHLTAEDGEKAMQEITRVCKIGGQLVVNTPIRHEPPKKVKIDYEHKKYSENHIKEYTVKEFEQICKDNFHLEKGGHHDQFCQRIKFWCCVEPYKQVVCGRKLE